MRLLAVVASALAFAGTANAGVPDPFARLGKPAVKAVTFGGVHWLCETWLKPRQGFFVQRCFYVSAVKAKAKPAAGGKGPGA